MQWKTRLIKPRPRQLDVKQQGGKARSRGRPAGTWRQVPDKAKCGTHEAKTRYHDHACCLQGQCVPQARKQLKHALSGCILKDLKVRALSAWASLFGDQALIHQTVFNQPSYHSQAGKISFGCNWIRIESDVNVHCAFVDWLLIDWLIGFKVCLQMGDEACVWKGGWMIHLISLMHQTLSMFTVPLQTLNFMWGSLRQHTWVCTAATKLPSIHHIYLMNLLLVSSTDPYVLKET